MNSWTDFLILSNDITLAAISVVGFSLLAYIALHNWRISVAQSLCFLLGSLLVVLVCALLIRQARTPATVNVLWRVQWIGFAYVPAAFVHFALELLRSTGSQRRGVRSLPAVLYTLSSVIWIEAVWGDMLAHSAVNSLADVYRRPFAPFNTAGLFWPFVVYVVGLTVFGALLIRRAQQRSMTPASRRRLFYLSISSLAPLLGVLPYLLLAATFESISAVFLLMLLGASTTGVGVMMTVMTYSVAYHGVLVPDRIVKYNFLRYILYGPFVGVVLIVCLQSVEPLAAFWGLPRDTITVFGVMLMTVLMPLFIGRIRPTVDMLIYRQDRAEMRWLRNLEQRTFTRSDLRQLLENTLIAVCGTLETESGFVAARSEDGFVVQASCGSRRAIKRFLQSYSLESLLADIRPHAETTTQSPPSDAFIIRERFCLLALYSTTDTLVGIIGVACHPQQLSREARRLIGSLAHQMELALSHMQLQENLFAALRGLSPQSETLHQINTDLEQVSSDAEPSMLAPDIALLPDFSQLVKDALSHYWGGPKLSDSPLLGLRSVRKVLDEQGANPTKALQAVLRQAIDHVRPDEQLDPTAPEWMLYNILELRFLRGLRIREIVDTLAMSESDYYRKQRVAVEEVARQLAMMEDQTKHSKHSSFLH